MNGRLQTFFTRLEALSLRERVLLLAGTPLLIALVAEGVALGPARDRAKAARQQIVAKQGEIKALSETLAARPAADPLPALDQLQRQRDDLARQISAADDMLKGVRLSVDWGSVVRATAGSAPSLALTQMRTTAPELVFNPASALRPPQAAARPGAAAAAASAASATMPTPEALGLEPIYRHRAELSLQGDFDSIVAYLLALQRVPGDLHWDKLQLSVGTYPQATVQLSLYTLSNRAATPFLP